MGAATRSAYAASPHMAVAPCGEDIELVLYAADVGGDICRHSLAEDHMTFFRLVRSGLVLAQSLVAM